MAFNNPKPDGERIKKLMERVENGDIKIPKFQRGYVWKQKSILELLDSLYRGYPIGSLLFWRTKVKIKGERNIGGYELKNTLESYPTNYVLDGQQRLTTIYSVFANKENHPGMDKVFDIYFDFTTKSFVPEKSASPESIPLHALFDNRVFQSIVRNLDPDTADAAADLQEIFMNYEIPIVTIFEMDIEEVSTIFERINSTGKTLTVFDLMVAATWSEDFDLRDALDKLKEELGNKNFDDISDSTILKCLTSVMTGNQNRKSIFSLRDCTEEIKPGIEKTKYGIFRAIDFISTELSIPSINFLPYDFQLILLSYFFSNVSLPTPEMIDTLKKWFWKSSFSERYQGANETLLENDLKDCKKLIAGDTNIFDFSLECTTKKLMRSEFKKGTAFSNAFVALLASKRPKNLMTGTLIDTNSALSIFNRKEFHHIFPKAFLKQKSSDYTSNSVCNIVILSSYENKKISAKEPFKYFQEIRCNLGSKYHDVLESNLIPTDDVTGIKDNDYDFFLELRAELILDEIKKLV